MQEEKHSMGATGNKLKKMLLVITLKNRFLMLPVLCSLHPAFCQNITLEQVIHYAHENSPEALKTKTSKENKYWEWKTYKAEYKPQLLLNSRLPVYQNKNIPVTQDDGSARYRNINNGETFLGLSLEQNIGLTGGKLFLSSDLSRLDDFNKNSFSYSGSPFHIGLKQPIFAFNSLKWKNRIEPLKYEESLKEYTGSMEEIAYNTAFHYFNLLIAQINFQIASVNKANADTMYSIGKEKYVLGKLSKAELLQLEFGIISAQKSMANAGLSIKTSRLELSSYTGIKDIYKYILNLPDSIFSFHIPDSLALVYTLDNSKQSIVFKRKLMEARRDEEKARRESRWSANLSVSYGKRNIANSLPKIYDDTRPQQTLNFGVTVPLVDWGRSKAARKTAEANLKLTEYTVRQSEINFKQEVITEIEKFRMLQDFIVYSQKADKTAAERYNIARLSYTAGNISITEYNIALNEKDNARRDYIRTLRDYWLTYYSIRILTLYDFKNNIALINS